MYLKILRRLFFFSKDIACSKDTGHVNSFFRRGLRGSVVECMTCNLEAPGLSCTESSVFFVGVSLGKTFQNPSLDLVKTGNT